MSISSDKSTLSKDLPIALSKINKLVRELDSLNDYDLWQTLEVQERWMWQQ
jgi:hypothetical protein